jgi:hypothetical protein
MHNNQDSNLRATAAPGAQQMDQSSSSSSSMHRVLKVKQYILAALIGEAACGRWCAGNMLLAQEFACNQRLTSACTHE